MMEPHDLPHWANHKTAEDLYRAFMRLTSDEGAASRKRLTKASVAAEAGYQRSILSARRYPELCDLIFNMQGKSNRATSSLQKLAQLQRSNHQLREKIASVEADKAMLLSRLCAVSDELIRAHSQIIDLRDRLGLGVVSQLPGIKHLVED